jgi:ATP-dependent Lhr-like helicase
VGGHRRWVSADDEPVYARALDAPATVEPQRPELTSTQDPLAGVLGRWARHRGPFDAATAAARFGLEPSTTALVLGRLETRGELVRGAFGTGAGAEQWCDCAVLRRLRRRTLERLRMEIAPVPPQALGRFLPTWHGLGQSARGEAALDQALRRLEGLPMSFLELERMVLPARIADLRPELLDARGTAGQLVWVGAGELRGGDGRISLFRRDRVGLLGRDPPRLDELGPIEQALGEHLLRHGASFFVDLLAASPTTSLTALTSALWSLVWAGLVTNDIFEPLRARAARLPLGTRRGARMPHSETAGRWALCTPPGAEPPSPTEQAHARTVMLLERYGVVSREMAAAEDLPGGFAPIYEVLREMEQAGKVRRGTFVAELGAAQFALPGVVDRLRAEHAAAARRTALVLAASDPANPFGSLLPWPALFAPSGPELRRAPGASVVLVDGTPSFYFDPSQRGAWSFRDANDDMLAIAAGALSVLAKRRRGRYLRLQQLDGEPARRASRASTLRAAGFEADHRALVLEVPLDGAAGSIRR